MRNPHMTDMALDESQKKFHASYVRDEFGRTVTKLEYNGETLDLFDYEIGNWNGWNEVRFESMCGRTFSASIQGYHEESGDSYKIDWEELQEITKHN